MKKVLLITLLACTSAQAEFFDGNKLLSRIVGDTYDYISAVSYIMGVSDATRSVTHCPPENVTAGQIGDMVKKHLESNPGVRHLTGDQHVTYVLQKAWPCKKGSGV